MRGEIASVGATGNVSSAFLHFDIATTNILEVNPTNWPGLNLDLMLKNYVDPREFIIAHRPKG